MFVLLTTRAIIFHDLCCDPLHGCTFEVLNQCARSVCCLLFVFIFWKCFRTNRCQVESKQDSGLLCKLEREPNAWLSWPEADLKNFKEVASQLFQTLNIFDKGITNFKSNIRVQRKKHNIQPRKCCPCSFYACKKKEQFVAWLFYHRNYSKHLTSKFQILCCLHLI